MNENKYPHGNVFYRRMAHDHPRIVRGEGVYLYDQDGKKYLDGSGGAIVVNAGHGVKTIANSLSEQAAKAAYIHPTMFTADVIEEYAIELAKIVPIDNPKFFFLTSGSEAVEAAIKLARQIQVERGEKDRHLTISRWMSYHGLSLGALAVTGKQKMRKLYEPMFKDVPHIPPPYCYRCPYKKTHPACDLKCADALEEEILKHGPENVSAFIAEPVSGATLGAVVPPDGYWQKIQNIFEKYGVLLIADEVMTGMGRTGKYFAVEHWGISPDILTIGKGASSGYYPLSAVVASKKHVELIWKGNGDFSHGGTFSHNAVGTAVGLATLKYLQEQKLFGSVEEKGVYLQEQLHKTFSELPYIGDIRGIGLMWGVEFVKDKASKQPFAPNLHLSQRIADEALKLGLVIYPGSGSLDGIQGDHLMIGPPYCISHSEIEELVDLLAKAIQTCISDQI